jgi:hypothetical protein
MRKKLISLSLFSILLISMSFPAAEYDLEENDYFYTELSMVSNSADQVPKWHVGDYWKYRIGKVSVDFQSENLSFWFNTTSYYVLFEVVTNLSESYEIHIKSEIPCVFGVLADFGDGLVNVTGDFLRSTNASMLVNKTHLGVDGVTAQVHGDTSITVLEQPYLKWLKGPIGPISGIQGNTYVNLSLDVPFAMLHFPMEVGMIWPLLENNVTISGYIDSLFLRVVSSVNNFIRKLGLPIRSGPRKLSDLLADLMPEHDPVLRIENVLEKLNVSSVRNISKVPGAFFCHSRKNHTVLAGEYSTYNISVLGGLAYIWYAPDVGNIIKISGFLFDLIPSLRELDLELAETNYTI